jgi:ATP-dependent Lhr-like helicase
MKTFEGTAIADETLSEAMRKDLDMPNTKQVLLAIRDGRIRLTVLSGLGELSPIARLGVERISMKTDLIPSDKLKRILIESARARILNESRTLVCTSCWNYAKIVRISELPNAVACPKCQSKLIGVLTRDLDEVNSLMQRKGKAVTKADKRILDQASESALIVKRYGKSAVVVQAGRRLTPGDAKRILRKERRISDRLFELIMDAERQALKRRFL